MVLKVIPDARLSGLSLAEPVTEPVGRDDIEHPPCRIAVVLDADVGQLPLKALGVELGQQRIKVLPGQRRYGLTPTPQIQPAVWSSTIRTSMKPDFENIVWCSSIFRIAMLVNSARWSTYLACFPPL